MFLFPYINCILPFYCLPFLPAFPNSLSLSLSLFLILSLSLFLTLSLSFLFSLSLSPPLSPPLSLPPSLSLSLSLSLSYYLSENQLATAPTNSAVVLWDLNKRTKSKLSESLLHCTYTFYHT